MNAPTTKKIIKIVFFVLLAYLIVRELTPIDFSNCRTHSSWNTDSSHNSHGMSYDVKHEYDTLNLLKADEGNDIYLNFYGLQDEEEDTETEKNSINIIISKDISLSWMRFVPLIKFINFESYNSYSWNRRIYKNGKVVTTNVSGSINITGSTQIYGICSAKKSAKFIDNIIINQIKTTIKDKVSTKLESLE